MQPISQRFAPQVLDAARRQLAELVAANTQITLAVVTSADGLRWLHTLICPWRSGLQP